LCRSIASRATGKNCRTLRARVVRPTSRDLGLAEMAEREVGGEFFGAECCGHDARPQEEKRRGREARGAATRYAPLL
jgi:hypothetical protein